MAWSTAWVAIQLCRVQSSGESQSSNNSLTFFFLCHMLIDCTGSCKSAVVEKHQARPSHLQMKLLAFYLQLQDGCPCDAPQFQRPHEALIQCKLVTPDFEFPWQDGLVDRTLAALELGHDNWSYALVRGVSRPLPDRKLDLHTGPARSSSSRLRGLDVQAFV